MQQQLNHVVNAIADHFPEGTKVSRPQGGLALWVELDKGVDTEELFEVAMRHKISISPGRMFTMQEQFRNCMRVSLGLPWSEELEERFKVLGRLIKGM